MLLFLHDDLKCVTRINISYKRFGKTLDIITTIHLNIRQYAFMLIVSDSLKMAHHFPFPMCRLT